MQQLTGLDAAFLALETPTPPASRAEFWRDVADKDAEPADVHGRRDARVRPQWNGHGR